MTFAGLSRLSMIEQFQQTHQGVGPGCYSTHMIIECI